MAISDGDVILPGTGFVYIAPPGALKPEDLVDPETPWENLGHTSREDGLTITRDGGDTETIGTWQNPNLRNRQDPTTFALTCFLHQVDNNVLELYFGTGDISVEDEFGVTDTNVAVDKALYVRIVDGPTAVGLYVPKVSISSEDDVEVDVEGFLAFPVRMTVLQITGSNLMTFIKPGLGLTTP
jgi:hypothetical protein